MGKPLAGYLGRDGMSAVLAAPGRWNLNEIHQARIADRWFKGPRALLLHCDGADGSTTFTDSSQYNHTITSNGNAQIDTAHSKFGGASLLLDGNGDYLSTSYSSVFALTNNYTIEAFIRPSSTSGYRPIFSICSASGSNFGTLALTILSGAAYAEVRPTVGGSITSITGGSISTNTWYHVALSVSSGSGKLFLDGTQVGSTVSLPNFSFTPVGVAIGANANGFNSSSEAFAGHIDELLIENRAIYTSNFTPPTEAY